MKAIAAVVAVAVALFIAAPAFSQTFVFDLRGSQEVPPVTSASSGGCFGQLDQPAATFSITCVHDVLAATVMHIHRAAAGANGPVAFDMGDPAVSPVTATWTGMTPADISELLAGTLYMNIHTAGRPAGEVRGQIVARSVDTVEFSSNGAQVVPPNGTSATGDCTADLDGPATFLAIACTHTLPGATEAHVHEAPFGSNGPAVFTFPSAASPLAANVPMTPRLIADFAATFLYLDVHTPEGTEEAPSAEIRGQIGTPPSAATTGTVIISKETFPAGGTGFGFTSTIGGPFVLDDGQSQTFTTVAPGAYTVAENDPFAGGFTLADVSCDDADSSGNVATRTASIQVGAGETVRCTFRNLQTSPTDALYVFHLSPDQEVPPLTGPDRGGCMGRFDAGASELTLVCVHDVDLPTIMHVHRGAPGVNGDALFDMGDPTSPVVTTWSGMTPGDVADLLAGNLYVNIHTSGRPAGAVRGQILPRTVDTIAFTMDGSQVVPPGSSPSSGNCTADLDTNATSLAISCAHNVVAPDEAHVHEAPRGENGPIVFTLPSAASPINSNMPLVPRLVADFAAGFLALEIHGSGGDESTDVIRGQIAEPVTAVTTGTIRIRKSTSPGAGTGFGFTETITPGAFTLNDGGEQVFLNVPAGSYTVTENATAGWSLTDISCGDADTTTNPATRTANIVLAAGESVTCTFRNLQSVVTPTRFVFHLSADQEVPPTASTARGGCYGQLDTTIPRLSLVCTHNVEGPAIAHIHEGAAGVNGPPLFDLGDPSSPIEATWDLSPSQMSVLLAGGFYVNIHTSGRPNGEVRGQMLPRTVDSVGFDIEASQEVPPTDSTATGECVADLADDASGLFVQCSHTVAGVTSIHLHVAPPGSEGPVVFDFPTGTSFGSTVPLSPRLVADFAAGFLYVNVHSADYPQGEIRGQVFGPAAAIAAATVPTLEEWSLLLLALSLGLAAWWRVR